MNERIYGTTSTVGYGVGLFALWAGATLFAGVGLLLGVALHTAAVRSDR